MKKKPACFALRAAASVIHDFLARSGERRVIILDKQRPVGVVSRASILRWREYHELAGRSRLAELTAQKNAAPESEPVVELVREVERQAGALAQELAVTDESPAHLMVAAATRMQLLLEDAVISAERRSNAVHGEATIGRMLG
jgi:hypothetical protein